MNISRRKLHALFSLTRHTNLSKLKAALACKIFDTMISTILTYNSEIWCVYAKPDFRFCERYLEVNNKASNIACRAELSRFPLNITINQKFSNTFCTHSLKMRNLSSNKLSLMSFYLHCNGKNSFHSHLMNMSILNTLSFLTLTLNY